MVQSKRVIDVQDVAVEQARTKEGYLGRSSSSIVRQVRNRLMAAMLSTCVTVEGGGSGNPDALRRQATASDCRGKMRP